jgi:hypothetical protein
VRGAADAIEDNAGNGNANAGIDATLKDASLIPRSRVES